MRLLSIGLAEGVHPVRSRVAWQAWTIERLLDSARTILFPLYSSLFTPVWLRMLGAEVGRDVEASTVLLIPSLTTIDDGAFLADDTMVATYELKGGWMRLEGARIGKRAFLGNSGMAGAGPPRSPRRAGRGALRGAGEVEARVLLARLARGAPAPRGERRRPRAHLPAPSLAARGPQPCGSCAASSPPSSRARSLSPCCSPWPGSSRRGVAVVAILASGVVLLAAGAVAAAITTIAKWLFVGPIRAGEHPLWSSFVWRTEVADTFTEMVAAPWFANAAAGTPALAMWLRSLGAKVGQGRLDRQLLAARARPRHPRRRRDGQSRMCGSDASVP